MTTIQCSVTALLFYSLFVIFYLMISCLSRKLQYGNCILIEPYVKHSKLLHYGRQLACIATDTPYTILQWSSPIFWRKGWSLGLKNDALQKFSIGFLLALHNDQSIISNHFGTTQHPQSYRNRQYGICAFCLNPISGKFDNR